MVYWTQSHKMGGTVMKWGILATGTIAKKFASTVEQMGAEGEQLVAVVVSLVLYRLISVYELC